MALGGKSKKRFRSGKEKWRAPVCHRREEQTGRNCHSKGERKKKKNPTKPKVKRSPPTSNSVWVLFKKKKKKIQEATKTALFQEKDHVNKANRGNLCSECNLPTMSPGNGNPSFPVW